MPPEPMYAVWTRDDSEEWRRKNRGDTNATITHGVPLGRAERVLKVLQSAYGDLHAEIHPVGKPPKAGTVGDPKAADAARTAAADAMGFSPGTLEEITSVVQDEMRAAIKQR